MEPPSLYEGLILKRYKRFLADVELPTGEVVVAHVPNTGSMKTCWEPGWKVWLSRSENPNRKLPWTLELTSPGEARQILVNTGIANVLAGEALRKQTIPELAGYAEVLPEQKILDSRFDFLLKHHATLPDCWVEVKNVTLLENGTCATFPDSVSARGRKHLQDLGRLRAQGLRAAMLYVISRTDAESFAPAHHIDPAYALALKDARHAGVEIYCHRVNFTPKEWRLQKAIPVEVF
jgi:sugar fermentation stimulation protein A